MGNKTMEASKFSMNALHDSVSAQRKESEYPGTGVSFRNTLMMNKSLNKTVD